MADILPFPATSISFGNGAKEALDEYNDGAWVRYAVVTSTDHGVLLSRTDHLLAWLWARGFKIVPLD